MRHDHHVEEHEDGVGRVGHHVHRGQVVLLRVVQHRPVDDRNADREDQRDVVEPPIDLEGPRHVHDIMCIVHVLWVAVPDGDIDGRK